ncbi:MAG TPA: HTTM domain-containing protein [Fimbriimonas sp.]|nr:HTTM domain-containing protein [Fimbriimonas sp.]
MSEPEKGFLKTLDEFWFGHGSPTSLGVFRILMGGLVFINLLMILRDWGDWFSERGYVPAWLGGTYLRPGIPLFADPNSPVIPRLDVLSGVTNPYLSLGIYLVTVLCAFLTCVGLWTRISSILLAIGLVSLHHRNALILHGGDTVMRVMVLYLAITPSGAACSLDRMIRLWKGKETGEPVRISLWGQRLIMYNMALIYFTTTWLKWFGNLWKEGTATYFPGRLAEFFRFPYPEFLREPPMVQITNYGTLAIEFALATLVFYKPLRKWVLLAGIMLHAWIEYSMNIPLFSYLMVSMYVTFYEGEEVSAWFQRVGHRLGKFKAIVHLPKGTHLSPSGAAFFDAADPLKVVTYVASEDEELRPVEVRKSWTHSLGAWLYGWIPGLWRKLLQSAVEPALEEGSASVPRQRAKR